MLEQTNTKGIVFAIQLKHSIEKKQHKSFMIAPSNLTAGMFSFETQFHELSL